MFSWYFTVLLGLDCKAGQAVVVLPVCAAVEAFDLLHGLDSDKSGFLWVETHGGVHLGILFRRLYRIARGFEIDARLDNEPHPGLARTDHESRGIFLGVIEVSV